MTSAIADVLQELHNLSDQLNTLGYPRPILKSFAPASMEAMDKIESRTRMAVPQELRAFLETTGGLFVQMGIDGFALTFPDRPTYPRPFGGLADVLNGAWCWNDYREDSDFPPSSIQTLNTEYICFGHCECDENSWDHFFYDRNGKFGVLHFDQEFPRQDAWEHLLELSSGKNSQVPLSLDEVLVPRLLSARTIVAEILQDFHEFRK